MKKYLILTLASILFSCCTLPKYKTLINKEVELNFKIHPNSKYRIIQEESTLIEHIPLIKNAEFGIQVKDLNDIELTVIKSEQIIEDEELAENFEDLLSEFGPTDDKPHYCHSTNGKKIESVPNKNKDANLSILGAIMAWNQQEKLPNTTMKIGEVYTVENWNKRKTTKTLTNYTLDKIEDNIAYLSYKETTSYKREEEKRNMNVSGELSSTGHLEFDIANNFYRLISKEKQGTLEQKFDSPNEENMKSIDENISIKGKSVIKIFIEK